MSQEIAGFNEDKRDEIAEQLEEIKCKMQSLLGEARELVRSEWPSEIDHANAYVFGHIAESLDNSNPYNNSFQSMIEELTAADGDPEPIDEFGESWADDEDDLGKCGSCGHMGTIGAACTCCGGRGVYE